MINMEKVLVLGGTGAMGRYVVPELLSMGYSVDVVALGDMPPSEKNLKYIEANAMDDQCIEILLKNNYDAVVDFMSYYVKRFEVRMPMFLNNTKHYIFLSSCRVFADDSSITEKSARLLDVSKDGEYLAKSEKEYSLYKAIEENMLMESGYKNWTIVRPATTYSTGRAQLVTLEANSFVYRAINHKKVVLPYEAMECQATMSWGGDVGKMIARLVLNEAAYGEDYNVATSEHHKWKEIAEYYRELIGLEYELVDKETYLNCIADENLYPYAKYQLIYARMFNRVTDNSKILKITGMKQEELMPLKEGLKKELSKSITDNIKPNEFIDKKMDEYFERSR